MLEVGAWGSYSQKDLRAQHQLLQAGFERVRALEGRAKERARAAILARVSGGALSLAAIDALARDYERSLAEASKMGLVPVYVAYLDAVFRVSRALVRVPAGADVALTACLLLAYAALLLRFVAVHGLREGAHTAGFEDEPALRPALRGLVAAVAARRLRSQL